MSISSTVPNPEEQVDPLGPADPSPPRARPGWWSQLRPLVLRIHFYAGVFIGPFILVAAITGLLYTATPQIENIVYRHELFVDVGSSQVPLADQVAAARAAHPSGDILGVTPPVAADSSTRVVFSDDTVGADYAMTVFVNPYTGEALGQVNSYGQWLGVRAWLDELHRTLHLDAAGRMYSELAASWVWVVVLAGLALWWGRRHTRRRDIIVPKATLKGRSRTRSWHAVVGTWLALGLLVLAASGLTWSRFAGATIGDIRSALDWRTPSVSTELATTPTDATATATPTDSGHAGHEMTMTMTGDSVFTAGVGIDGVLAAATAAGLQAPLDITPPADAGAAWTVGENKRSWPTSYDAVAVDGDTGQIVDRVDFQQWPFMAKLTDWIIGAHMGILFGIVNQLLLASLAIGLMVMVVLGYRMWWQRRPTRATGLTFGKPYPRGSLHELSMGPLIAVVAVTAISAYFVPLLGVSLAAFLLVDVVLGARSRSRQRRPAQPVGR